MCLKAYSFKEILFNHTLQEVSPAILRPEYLPNVDYVQYEENRVLIRNGQAYKRIVSSLEKRPMYQSPYVLEASRFSDSGHYYCVYSSADEREVLIKSYLYVIYAGMWNCSNIL